VRHDGGVQGLAFSADEQRLMSASLDGTLRVWDLTNGAELLQLVVPDGHQIYSMTSSDDGRLVATGEIGVVRIWDLIQGREIIRLPHDSLVNDVAFSPDDKLVASAGRDGNVRVFSVATGQETAGVAHALSANGLAFSPDSEILATASDDRTARVWALAPANLLDEACSSVTRNLSAEEWQRYLPDQPYRNTCPNVQ
jgi:WD40 repeat protein